MSFSCLAVLSNFSLLNYFVSHLAVLTLIVLLSTSASALYKRLGILSLFSILLGVSIIGPIQKLQLQGSFYYGGDVGFYQDTLLSLAKYSAYSAQITPLITLILNGLLLVFAFTMLLYLFTSRLKGMPPIYLYLTVLVCSATIVQHYWLGTLYLIDRAAIFLYPLVILSFAQGITVLHNRFSHTLLLVVLVPLMMNVITKVNLHKTALWYFDAHTETVLQRLNKEGKDNNRKVHLDFSWPFQSAIAYYYTAEKYDHLELVKNQEHREALNPNADVYLYLSNSLEKVGYEAAQQLILGSHGDTLFSYPSEGIYVLKIMKAIE